MLHSKSHVAAMAECSTQTLDRYIKSGIGPRVTRVGGRVMFTDPDVSEWLARCRCAA